MRDEIFLIILICELIGTQKSFSNREQNIQLFLVTCAVHLQVALCVHLIII